MSAHLAGGTLFAGRYLIVQRLAAGGMGAVYEAVHIETNRKKALKVMHAHLFENDEMRERFKREARISAEIESEFIVDVSDAGVDETTKMPFLVMELLRGEELGRRLKRVGRFPPDEALTYLRQTAMALDKTHAASIVHRDLKPENLFWTQREDGSPRAKILDFGVAKLVAKGGTGAGATQILGSPVYMAPEQFRIDTKLSGAADIFALGMMAFELLVGKWYWYKEMKLAPDVMAFAMVAFRGPQESAVQRAAELGVNLPADFDIWFRRITALEPAARFSKASEAVQALEQVFEGARISSFGNTVPLLGAFPGVTTPVGMTPVGATPPPVTPLDTMPLGATPPHITPPGIMPSVPVPERKSLPAVGISTSGTALPPRPAEKRSALFIVIGAMVLGVVGAIGGVVWFFTRSSPEPALQDEKKTEILPNKMPVNTASPGPSSSLGMGPAPPEPSVVPAPSSSPEPALSTPATSASASPMASTALAAPSGSTKNSPKMEATAASTKPTGASPKPALKPPPGAFGDMN